MSSVTYVEAAPAASARVMAVLTNMAAEVRATFIRILAYLCGIAVLALIAADFVSRIQDDIDLLQRPELRQAAWRQIERPQPAFAAPSPDTSGTTESYEIYRHADGGRKDILQWSAAGTALPLTSIEIYRPGGEVPGFGPASLEIAARTALWNVRDVQAAGVIDTKFGSVSLVAFAATAASKPINCTGFVRGFEDPLVQISGWSCGGAAQPAERQAVACLLNRLALLAAGSDPKLATLFARAELRREADCGATTSAENGWLGTMDEPQLRGAVASN